MMFAYQSLLFFMIPLFILVVFLAVRLYVWQRKTASLLGVNKGQLLYFSLRRKLVKSVVVCVGFIALFIACARPQKEGLSACPEQKGRDIVVLLDISRSMLAQDSLPSRLDAARSFIKQVVHSIPSDRVALVVFSGQAVCLCPLTRDHDIFFTFLDAVDVSTISSGTTAYAPALKRLSEIAHQGGKKQTLALLVTDGEDFSPDVGSLKQELAQKNIVLFTVGVGTREGAPIALYNDQGVLIGHHKDQQGKVVISRLCPELLQQLSASTGAHYIEGTSMKSVASLQKALDRFERERDTAQISERRCAQELYYYPAAVSLICFLGGWLL